MAYQDRGGYKNPKMPKPRDVERGPSVGTAAPVAPARGGGLMQRAATARVRQTKPGQPPIPSPPATQPMQAPPRIAPMTDPGQRRDDLERERIRLRQQEEKRRQAEEQRKKAELLQWRVGASKPTQDYRTQALQQMAAKGGADEEDKYPTIPKPGETETQIHALKQAGEEEAESEGTQFDDDALPDDEGLGGEKDWLHEHDVSSTGDPLSDEAKKEIQLAKETKQKEEQAKQAEQELENMEADKGDAIYDKDGTVVGYQSKGSQGQWVYDAKTGKKYSSHGLAGALGLDEVYDEAGGSATYPGVKEAQESGKEWLYDPETGEKIGWKTVGGEDDGQFYDMSGAASTGHAPSNAITEDLYKEKFPGKASYDKTMSQFTEWLNQKTGIPEEELQGQIAQVHMQSSDQIAKFANLMAARGVGAAGLMGAGMGQIASQAVAAIANIKFENEKMKIEEKLNKMKTAAALAGQWMSEENRMKIFEEMSQLDKDKFDWQQKQDENANWWADLNDTAALLQAKEGWDEKALAKAQAAKDEGWTSAEVQQHLMVDDKGKITWTGAGPSTYAETTAFGEHSEEGKQNLINKFHKKAGALPPEAKPKSVSDIVQMMKDWYGVEMTMEEAQAIWDTGWYSSDMES